MSRLDSVIRRLQAQCACLNRATAMIADLPGPILEFGLGQGRTYDHLRLTCPEREVFVFEREVAEGAERVPDNGHLLLGDIREALPRSVPRFARAVPLIHSDIGTGDVRSNAELARFLSGYLPKLLCPGGIVVADQDLAPPDATALALPPGVKPGRYFMYRMA